MKKILEVKELSKKYINKNKIVEAVESFSLNLFENEFISIVGPSGCGKSTILSIIGKLDKKSAGSIKCDKNTKIGYMFQDDLLFPWLTVYENTILGLKMKKILTKENIKHVETLLKKYGLNEFKNSYPKELSGGMRQRVG